MTADKPEVGSFEDPSIAMAFRDVLSQTIATIISKLRPSPQYGTVLSVARGGASFRVGTLSDPSGPAPEGVGNPRQVYYAQVQLDNGEIVPARVHENIPVARSAAMWEPGFNEGSTDPYLIEGDTYRFKTIVPRTDSSGFTYDSVEPAPGFMTSAPYVPPRVMIEGSAGKYIVTRIIRGTVGLEDPVLTRPNLIQPREAFNKPGSDSGTSDMKIISGSFTTELQGWVGDSAWLLDSSSLEIQLAHSGSYKRYEIHPSEITAADYGKWHIVAPKFETVNRIDNSLPPDIANNVLLVYFVSSSLVHFYVCNQTISSGLTISNTRYLNGSVVLRSRGGDLQKASGIPFPVTNPLTQAASIWNLGTSKFITPSIDLGIPGYDSVLGSTIQHLQHSLTGGGRAIFQQLGGSSYLSWKNRFVVIYARNTYCPAGHWLISMPPVGTSYAYVGALGTDLSQLVYKTTITEGFEMPSWHSLWWVPPWGRDQTSLNTGFVLVKYNGWFDIPDHWVCLAKRNGDVGSEDIILGTGQNVDLWKEFDLTDGWIESGPFPARYCKRSGVVYFKHAIANVTGATITSGSVMSAALPAGYRPANTQFHPGSLQNADGGLKTYVSVSVQQDGDMAFHINVPTAHRVHLDSINYIAEN